MIFMDKMYQPQMFSLLMQHLIIYGKNNFAKLVWFKSESILANSSKKMKLETWWRWCFFVFSCRGGWPDAADTPFRKLTSCTWNIGLEKHRPKPPMLSLKMLVFVVFTNIKLQVFEDTGQPKCNEMHPICILIGGLGVPSPPKQN